MHRQSALFRLADQVMCMLLLLPGFCATAAESGIRTEPPAAATAKSILEGADFHGGLIVHLGCGNGRLTAALHTGAATVVVGLDTDVAHVTLAREHIGELGLYGRVSADVFDGKHLPFAENLVNLIN